MLRFSGCALVSLVFFVGMTAAAAADQAAGQRSVEEIEKIVREYLLRDPKVILDAVERYRARAREEQAERSRAAVREHREEIFADPDSPVGGNPRGDVTVVEFFDYRCGYCRRFAPVLDRITEQDPRVRIIYKELPILGEESFTAARAALAARTQGGYHALHGALMAAEEPLSEQTIMTVARSVGLDTDRLSRDMQAPEILDAIGRNRRLAEALGIDGTPALIVGDQVVGGAIPLDDLKAMIARSRRRSE